MESIVRCFTWYIGDVRLWLPLDMYSVRSPSYSLGDSQCKFCLKFVNDKLAKRVSVFLCRSPDVDPAQVEMLVSVALKTVSGRIVRSAAFKAPFSQEGLEDLAFAVDNECLIELLEGELDKDKVIVTCESTLLEPKFIFLNEHIELLSANLLQLRRDGHFANAYLLASEERIPVHKEIVCSRSPVLDARLKDAESSRESFPAAVLKVMLDYMYSGSFSLRELDARGVEQLSDCASHYEVRDLATLMAPRRTCVTSLLHTKAETHALRFPSIGELCRSRHSVEHHRIKMQFNEAVEMSVKLIFEDYNKCGMIRLETTFWNLVNVKNISFRLILLDPFLISVVVKEELLVVTSEEKMTLLLNFGCESILARRILVLPNDVLALDFETKFQLSGQIHISDPDANCASEGRSTIHEASIALVKNMTSLMESKLYADSFLVLCQTRERGTPPSDPISVHKSILSVRSPLIKNWLRSSPNAYLSLNEWMAQNLVHYAYTGCLLSAAPHTLVKVHNVAEYYGMHSMKRACEEAASKMVLNHKNVFSILLIAIHGEMHELQELCKDFIARNMDLIIGSYRWEELRKDETAWNEIRRYIAIR